jgi:hypothetical protein
VLLERTRKLQQQVRSAVNLSRRHHFDGDERISRQATKRAQ